MSKTCDNYVMRLCDVIKYFTLILLQFEIICVFGHPGRTYMSTWFCYAKLGATLEHLISSSSRLDLCLLLLGS